MTGLGLTNCMKCGMPLKDNEYGTCKQCDEKENFNKEENKQSMTDEEIEKIARKVLELQKEEGVKTTQSLLTFQEVQQRYHKEVFHKFGTTGSIDSAIRTVATYSQGQRYVARLGGANFDNAVQVADRLYRLILGEEVFKQ